MTDYEPKTPKHQRRAMLAQLDGTPYARTRAVVKAEAERMAEEFGGRPAGVIVTSWLEAKGDSYALHLDPSEDGHRVVVHHWHSTGEIVVRRVSGSFFRPRPGHEGVEFDEVIVKRQGDGYGLYRVSRFATCKTREGALTRAVREVLS